MRKCLVLCLAATLLGGCTEAQLNNSTLKLTATIGALQRDQILDNLGEFLNHPLDQSPLPSMVLLGSGTVQVTDSITPTLRFPYNGRNLFTEEVDLSGQDQWTENWGLSPVIDPEDLERLQILFHWAASKGTANADDLQKSFPIVYIRNPDTGYAYASTPGDGSLRAPSDITSATTRSSQLLPQQYRDIYVSQIPANWWSESDDRPAKANPNDGEPLDCGVHSGHHLWITSESGFSQFALYCLKAASNTAGNGGRAKASVALPSSQ
jgi:hypothetical protein